VAAHASQVSAFVTIRLSALVRALGACVVIACVCATEVWGQTPAAAPAPSVAPPAPSKPDPLGRDTPRSTLVGFLNAARKGETELAAQYLSTRVKGEAAATLADQLYVVLDARLPPRLTLVSNEPEGSRANPLRPDEEIVGTVADATSAIDIVVVRTGGPDATQIWLFSPKTLDAVPAIYKEITLGISDALLPRVLTRAQVGGVRIFGWLVLLVGLPLFYGMTVILNRVLTPIVDRLWRMPFKQSRLFARNVLPLPARLLLVAAAIRWLLTRLPLPLLVRQFLSSLAVLVTIGALVWLLIVLTGEIEAYVRRRVPRASQPAAQSLVRVLRRAVDLMVIFMGVLALLRHFGVDPTPALAGLGVGGIAVALAAQKTLENVIAGASLILDQAVTAGDSLKMGQISGTVDHIGLRSTRIRTFDRTIVSVPNSQIANASIETISARDKCWFHHIVALRYDTTPDQVRAVVDGISGLLARHPLTERDSVRVRFLRLGAFSLDVDISAYLRTTDWNHFLDVQESLLFGITDTVAAAGAEIALPSQTMYVDGDPSVVRTSVKSGD
jgi:MscS family membrane protein